MYLKLATTAALLATFATTLPACADWPAKVFAPYLELDAGDGLQMVDVLAATSQKYFTLAFLLADKKGNPAWGGTDAISTGIHATEIAALRAHGGDVIFSFGGILIGGAATMGHEHSMKMA